jgi:hypothetical protein
VFAQQADHPRSNLSGSMRRYRITFADGTTHETSAELCVQHDDAVECLLGIEALGPNGRPDERKTSHVSFDRVDALEEIGPAPDAAF